MLDIRRTYETDGELYDVVRGDLHPEMGGKRRWEFRRTGVPGKPDAKIFLSEQANTDRAFAEAARRLLGPDVVEVKA